VAELFIRDTAMQIIINPKQFDVILTENLFGDIYQMKLVLLLVLDYCHRIIRKLHFLSLYTVLIQAKKNIANPIASIFQHAMLFGTFWTS
jgi:3-isopropylmalate dehydrogenase